MSDRVTVHLVGAGGSMFTFDLPLKPVFAERVAKGQLQPASMDDRAKLQVHGILPGSEPNLQAVAEAAAEAAESDSSGADSDGEESAEEKPSRNRKSGS